MQRLEKAWALRTRRRSEHCPAGALLWEDGGAGRLRATWNLGGLSGGGRLPSLGVPGCSVECDVERVRVTRQDWVGCSCPGRVVQMREGASWA